MEELESRPRRRRRGLARATRNSRKPARNYDPFEAPDLDEEAAEIIGPDEKGEG